MSLNENWFLAIWPTARAKIAEWKQDYNERLGPTERCSYTNPGGVCSEQRAKDLLQRGFLWGKGHSNAERDTDIIQNY